MGIRYFKNALWGSANTVGTSSKEHRHLLEACMLELQVLSDISVRNHDNIVTLLAVSWTLQEGNIYPILVTELACEEYPTLAQFLPKFDPALSARYELCQHVVEGLLAIHNLRVVYGDIKPENILIFQSKSGSFGFTAKLSDFGFCQPSDDSNLEAGGTPYWNAPECVAGASLDLKAHAYTPCRDIYTLGLLITYILTGAKPFGALSKEGIIEMKMQNQVSRLVSSKLSSIGHMQNSGQTTSLTCDFINTIRRMVLLSPEDRPSLHDIQKSFE
jgi:serine/threonine protein kinase